MTEQQLQQQCFLWLWNCMPHLRYRLYHNNNNSHNKIAGNIAKSMGVVSGVSDFTFIGKMFVAFIEMKTETGKQSEEQKVFQSVVTGLYHQYYIVRSLKEFQELIYKLVENE